MSKFTDEDDALLEKLGVEVETKQESSRTAREERIIAGFEEIQRFVDQHGCAPSTARIATSSSAFLPSVSIASASCRNAAPS